MRWIGNISILVLALGFTACDTNAEDLRLLVGDGDTPIVTPSATETLSVTLAHLTDKGSSNLEVVLTPNQKLFLKRYSLQWVREGGEHAVTTEMEETLTLSDEAAADLRARLAAFRPAQLSREVPFILPKDCFFTSDVPSRAVVGFEDEAGAAGLFILQPVCENENAKELANGLRDAIVSIPANETAANFRW